MHVPCSVLLQLKNTLARGEHGILGSAKRLINQRVWIYSIIFLSVSVHFYIQFYCIRKKLVRWDLIILSIAGIEKMFSIQYLDLSNNQISDVSKIEKRISVNKIFLQCKSPLSFI